MKKNAHIQINLFNNRNNLNSLQLFKKQSGFSLIELMVASIISIIVLLAASSTFFSTYRLKEQVKSRVEYEQDVRNAANLLRSDARQLGNFSCMQPPTPDDLSNIFNATFSPTPANGSQYLSTNFNGDIGVTQASGSQSLIITYINEDYANGLVATDCGKDIPDLANHINAAVYLVGTTNDGDQAPGLYRVNYSNGVWTSPQLIISNVSDIQYSFEYDGHQDADCPQTASDIVKPNNVSSQTVNTANYEKPPVLITATLTINPTQANNQSVNYVINAMVRQGEVCINNQATQASQP